MLELNSLGSVAPKANHDSPLVLPVPAVLDSGAAVLLHLLLEQNAHRPALLDAAALREICSVGALLLAAALRARSRSGRPPRILNLSYPLRLELSRHPLLAFADAAPPPPFHTTAHRLSTIG